MSRRELVVLGTASMTPTRTRNHNGYVVLFDELGVLFDPGEGTQRQMTLAGVSATDLTRIAITHLHGDHALGLAGVALRLAGEAVPHPVPVSFPASGAEQVHHLLHASVQGARADLVLQPLDADGVVPPVPGEVGRSGRGPTLEARRLDHTTDAFGYRLTEPDGVSLDPVALAAAGVHGPDVGRLLADGEIVVGGRRVRVADVGVPRRGQSVAFVMDTRLCDAVGELADGVDLLVIESTFLDRDADQATAWGHLTARQAARVAAAAGVGHLVLTHFSQRYPDPDEFEREARLEFDGPLTVAADLDRVPLPPRRRPVRRPRR